MQPLSGFRDFLPASCAERNYIFAKWREVAGRYGFVEFDGPVLEELDLYKKKSGDEIVRQLYEFVDKGERAVALRPEMTPTLARIVAAEHRQFRKPLKWFSIPQVFRYERPQRGRLREHFQLNCDIIGEESPEADAELIALAIDVVREYGFTSKDFVVRNAQLGAQPMQNAVSMPALAFPIGDVVLGEMIRGDAADRTQMEKTIAAERAVESYVVIAKEEQRGNAIAMMQQLRDRRYRVDYSLAAAKVARQFRLAEQSGARLAVVFGDEWPQVGVKDLISGEQR